MSDRIIVTAIDGGQLSFHPETPRHLIARAVDKYNAEHAPPEADASAPPDADAIYARYKNAHTPLITIQHADREVPGLRQRLEGLAKQRGVPLVYEPSPSHEHLARLERQAQRGIVPGGPTVSRHDAKAFLGALEAIASGKVRVA
jgi:hypothetical protein